MVRICVTGIGAVTPIGIGAKNYLNALSKSVCGIDEITKIDTSDLKVKRAGEIKGFDPKDYLPAKLSRDLEPYMQYAYVAAEEALRSSGLNPEGDRVAVVMGSALNGIDIIGKSAALYATENKEAGPKLLTKAMGNIAAAHFSIAHKIKGPSMTVSTACSSGGDAVSLAAMLIRSDAADAAVVMAGEDAITPTLIQSLTRAGALSKTGRSVPFDISRDGFVIGTGGGALVLERENYAIERRACILSYILGFANNTDAFNPVSPDPEGKGAAACMRLALRDSGLLPRDIGYINAHGTSTKMGDIAECRAIRSVFEDRLPLVSSTKGLTGHMMGAGGITELIACINAVNSSELPVNAGCDERDPECDIPLVTEANRHKKIKAAMSNSMGFGGQNSCVIVGF